MIRTLFIKGAILVMNILFIHITALNAQELDYFIEGQLSAWLTVNPEKASQVGARYIPAFNASWLIKDNLMADIEGSVNMYGYSTFKTPQNQYGEGDLSAYRIWGRISGAAWETRLGLQKINFGPAMVLRPLMWFDSIDPRDPLQLTEGVYAFLGRYYFMNNANAWFWILYGNEAPRGFDPFNSHPYKPEIGGRFQHPFLSGELAISAHYRTIDLQNNYLLNILAGKNEIDEVRYGLDGKWDAEVGLWLEAALIDRDFDLEDLKYHKMITLGIDYTFNLGNGLHVTFEHMFTEFSNEILSWREKPASPLVEQSGIADPQSLSALVLSYPLGIIDNVMLMLYGNWQEDQFYRFINWERKFDNWSIFIMGFWNPDDPIKSSVSPTSGIVNPVSSPGLSEINLYAGRGIQVMFVYNH